MLKFIPRSLPNPNVLVGLDSPDDAGVYKLTDEVAIVQTVDFFTPIVDDPYWFGAIAAANALSDVYAMGGTPITAMNLVGFPITKLPKQVLAEILRGGAEKCLEAGATLMGGHSIDDPEPKFGLSVTGIVHPNRIGAKAGARPGDKLILTKPIGVGIITTATKQGQAKKEDQDEAIRVMAKLNNQVAALAEFAIPGMTDITGFGLLGHASEMARESMVGMKISVGRVPVLGGAYEYAQQGIYPGGTKKNLEFLTSRQYVEFDSAMEEIHRIVLCDAVTSGGLLLSVPKKDADRVVEALTMAGAIVAAVIGDVVADHPGVIRVVP